MGCIYFETPSITSSNENTNKHYLKHFALCKKCQFMKYAVGCGCQMYLHTHNSHEFLLKEKIYKNEFIIILTYTALN